MATAKKKNAAHAKERKYTSQQGHEQAYKGKRKSKVVGYKEAGGVLEKKGDVWVYSVPSNPTTEDNYFREETAQAMIKNIKENHPRLVGAYSDTYFQWRPFTDGKSAVLRKRPIYAEGGEVLASVKDTKAHHGYSTAEWNKLSGQEKFDLRELVIEDQKRGESSRKKSDAADKKYPNSQYFTEGLTFLNW